jgi:1-acyl-sn-glycerol-3-phosphate acyltransferase
MGVERKPLSFSARCAGALKLIVFYAFSALFIPMIIIAAVLKPGGYAWYRFARGWVRGTLALFGVSVDVRGLERLEKDRDYVLLANHRSHFDVLAIMQALGVRETKWVAKRELLRVPIFGYGLRVTGQILIDRKDHSQAVEALRANMGKRGVSVVFFAEGERSMPGQLSSFKKGGAAFAIDAGLSIVPVAVTGSDQVLPKRSLVVMPGRIKVEFSEPMSTEGLGAADREHLTIRARDRIAALLLESVAAVAREA